MDIMSPTPTPTTEKKKTKFQLSFFPKVLSTPRLPNIAKATASFANAKISTPSLSEHSKRKSRSFVAIFASPPVSGKSGGGSTFDSGGGYEGFQDEESSEFDNSFNMSGSSLPMGPVL